MSPKFSYRYSPSPPKSRTPGPPGGGGGNSLREALLREANALAGARGLSRREALRALTENTSRRQAALASLLRNPGITPPKSPRRSPPKPERRRIVPTRISPPKRSPPKSPKRSPPKPERKRIIPTRIG